MAKQRPQKGMYICKVDFFMNDDRDKILPKFLKGKEYYFNGSTFENEQGTEHWFTDCEVFHNTFTLIAVEEEAWEVWEEF